MKIILFESYSGYILVRLLGCLFLCVADVFCSANMERPVIFTPNHCFETVQLTEDNELRQHGDFTEQN